MNMSVKWFRRALVGLAVVISANSEAIGQTGGGGSAPPSVPVFQNLTLPLAAPAPVAPFQLPFADPQARGKVGKLVAGTPISPTDYTTCSANADQPTQEIFDLAAALKNDPQTIFNYVYENIDLEPSIESSKGALGTYLDQSGSSFDQSSLLVALLRSASANITASGQVSPIGSVQYVIGTTTLTAGQMGLAALPAQLGMNAGAPSATIPYAWVQAVINGTTVTYNPAGKTYTLLPGSSLSHWFGSQPSATPSSVWSYLTATAQSIFNQAGQNYAAVTAFIGGRRLNTTAPPLTNMVSNGSPPSDTIPAAYRTTLLIETMTTHASFCTDQVYGHMVVATGGSTATQPGTIWIDTVPFYTYTQGTSPMYTGQNQELWISHAGSLPAQSANITLPWVGWNVFNFGIGRVGRFRAQHDASLAARNTAYGGWPSGNSILSLLALSSGQLSQTSHATELMDQLSGTYTQNHNMLQIVSNNETINTPLIATSVTGITSTPASGLQVSPNSVAYALSALQSAQEAVALQGVGVPGATSAATLLSAVSAPTGLQILAAYSHPPPLTAYNTAQNAVFGDYLYWGYDICLPIVAPSWNASGPAAPFLALAPNGTSAFVLVTPDGNVYKGAATPVTIDSNSFVSTPAAAAGQASSGRAGSGLAVNPSSGEVTFSAPLLSVGSKGSPYSLEFDLSYSSATSAQRGQSSSGGIGWSHNLDISLTPSSDGFAILGSDLTGPAIPGIVAMYELLLNSNVVATNYAAGSTPSTSTLLITAATAGWFVQQTNQDVVTVNNGGAQEVFAHMPDGSYRPAEPSPARLTLPAGTGGTYTLSTGHGTTMVFSNAGPIQSMTDSGNHTTNFAYSINFNSGVNQLHTVATAHHTMTFNYQSPAVNQAPKLGSVSDETGRSVSLGYTYNLGFYPSDQILNSATLVDSTQAKPRTLSFAYKTITLTYTTTSNLYVGGASSNLLELTGAYDPMSKESTILYDSRIMPTTFTDALSNPTRYFTAGNRSEVDDAFGNATHTHTYPLQPLGADLVFTDSYDALNKITNTRHNYAGQLVSEQAPDWSYPKLYGYDGSGNLQSTSWASTSGGPTTTSATYNSCNLPLTTTDWLTRTTTYTYEQITGNPCLVGKIVHPTVDGTAKTPAPTEQFTYTDGNRPATVTAADNEVTHYGYGENGNPNLDLTSITQDWNRLNLKTTLAYDSVGNVQTVTDPRTYATTFGYDAARRVILKTTPPIAALGGATFNTVYKYDLDGRPNETDQDSGTAGQPLVAKTTYDSVGNVKTQTQPTTSTAVAHTTAYNYDADNRLSTITDPAGQLFTHTYDPNSRLYQVLDINNVVLQTYHYTDDGLTHSVAAGTSPPITYGYDYRDRLTTTTYADGTYEQLTLDNGGRVNPRRTRNNVLIGYAYDNLDRVSTETDPGATAPISFTYDLVGRPLTVGDQNGTFAYMYDTAGRQKQTTRPDLKVTGYTYDADGNTAILTYPDGYQYTYGHDELDRMTNVQETVPQTTTPITLATYGYNALSERASLTYGNGTSSAYTYDPFEGLHTVTHNIIGMIPVTFTYDRDANERRLTDTVSSPTFLWHPPAAGSTPYTPNTLNQYGAINGMTLGYDANGNLQADPTASLGTTTYGWDLKSRMTTIANSQHTATYYYDPFSRRGSKLLDGVAYVDVFDGQNKIAQYTGSNVETEHFVYGLGNAPIVRETITGTAVTARTYLHLDGLGSVVALSNSSGALQSSNAFSPWGEGPSTVVTSFGFAGMSFDQETGLYFDNARYYSPQQGRFISPDPIGVEGGVDLYAYAGNDPLNATDGSGLCGFCTWVKTLFDGLGFSGSGSNSGSGSSPGGGSSITTTGSLLGDDVGAKIACTGEGCSGFVGAGPGGFENGGGGGGRFIPGPETTTDTTTGSSSDVTVTAYPIWVPGFSLGYQVGGAEGQPYQIAGRSGPPPLDLDMGGNPYTLIQKPGAQGRYTTYDQYGPTMQYRGEPGPSHGDVPRPNVKVYPRYNDPATGRTYPGTPTVRPALPEEIPGLRIPDVPMLDIL